MSLFEKAKPSGERIKMLVYGEPGTGKTVTALHFPNPVVIDTEKGTEYYGEYFDFYKLESGDPVMVSRALDELINDPGEYKTAVLDSATVLYDNIIDKQLARKRAKTGNPNYEIQPLDYKFIKADMKAIIQKILALDMNVIVTAHSKAKYSQEEGEFMKVLGTMAEVSKELPYIFDVELELTFEDGKFVARVQKDRTNRLPARNEKFEFNYQSFVGFLGNEALERDPVVFDQKRKLEQRVGRSHRVEFHGEDILTAGIEGGTLEKLQIVAENIDQDVIKEKLRNDWMADSMLDLREDEAQQLLSDLEQINQ